MEKFESKVHEKVHKIGLENFICILSLCLVLIQEN